MASSNFTYGDVIDAARKQLNDDAQRRWNDSDIIAYYLPRALQQLRADRPDLWYGNYGAENFKPSAADPLVFDDAGFNTLVEALLSIIHSEDEEASSASSAGFNDAKSERSRRS
jgi:hypothetical protein